VPYNPGRDGRADLFARNYCVDVGVSKDAVAGQPDSSDAGADLSFQIRNNYPGGAARTPGYWKN